VRENSARVRRARTVASVSVGSALLYAAPTLSWWLIVPFALSVVNTETLDWRIRRSRVPEYHAAGSILWSQAMTIAAAALTGGPRSPMLILVAVPTAFAATRFRDRVASLATLAALIMLLSITFVPHPAQTWAHPAGLIIAVVVVIGVSAATQALQGAEVEHRNSATLDPLTGLLNRQGLDRRFRELADQARLMDEPISLLVCDIDHFKDVNDAHGHTAGDALLRDVAYEMRKQLRSFELIYRIGGEEFLVLLPGAELADARMLADRLCLAVRACREHGPRLTISVGVATRRGADAQFTALFEAADRALYGAKAAGRDGVCVEIPPSTVAGEIATPAGGTAGTVATRPDPTVSYSR
jgi:diguanylate cyclase (GGDEF)-like protein